MIVCELEVTDYENLRKSGGAQTVYEAGGR